MRQADFYTHSISPFPFHFVSSTNVISNSSCVPCLTKCLAKHALTKAIEIFSVLFFTAPKATLPLYPIALPARNKRINSFSNLGDSRWGKGESSKAYTDAIEEKGKEVKWRQDFQPNHGLRLTRSLNWQHEKFSFLNLFQSLFVLSKISIWNRILEGKERIWQANEGPYARACPIERIYCPFIARLNGRSGARGCNYSTQNHNIIHYMSRSCNAHHLLVLLNYYFFSTGSSRSILQIWMANKPLNPRLACNNDDDSGILKPARKWTQFDQESRFNGKFELSWAKHHNNPKPAHFDGMAHKGPFRFVCVCVSVCQVIVYMERGRK